MRVSSNLFLLVAVMAFSLLGCWPTYQVRRTALVQPPAPPAWSGRVAESGITVSDATVLWESRPTTSPDSDSGLYVTKTQVEPKLHLKVGDNTSLWVPFSYGLAKGAFAAAPGLLEPPERGVFSFGFGFAHWARLTESWYAGFSGELQVASIPSNIESTCISDCEGGDGTFDGKDVEAVPVARGSFVVGRELDGWRVFGGVSVRNHPTNTRLANESESNANDIDGEVEAGPPYAMPGLGVEVDLGEAVSMLVQVYQPVPLSGEELIYGPIASIGVDFHVP